MVSDGHTKAEERVGNQTSGQRLATPASYRKFGHIDETLFL
jgi:hypothetical protein